MRHTVIALLVLAGCGPEAECRVLEPCLMAADGVCAPGIDVQCTSGRSTASP